MTDLQVDGWATMLLGSLLTDIQPGFASGKHNSTGEGLPHLRPMNVSSKGRIDRSVLKYVEPTAGRADLRLRHGDVLFNNTNSPELVGKTALFDQDDEPAFSNHMTRLRTDPAKLEPAYLALRLHQAWREGYFAEHCNNHVSQASVGRDVLRAFPIELPPLEVQQAIAALSSSVDGHGISSRHHLAAAQRAIERFRQAVLAAACSGRLTADWRDKHPDVEPADRAIERRRDAKREELGRRYKEPRLPDPTELPKIPETWTWAALPELGELGRGKSKHRPRNDPRLYGGPYPFIQTGDVARSGGKLKSHSQTYNSVGLAQSRLWPERTVCITIAANIADSGLLTYPACFPDSVVGLIAGEGIAVPEYMELFIRTARRDLSAFAPATAQANINLAILSEVAVALPPAEEQREVVGRVEAIYTVGNKIEAAIQAATKRVERSAQAVLAKAFRGELRPAGVETVSAELAAKRAPS